MALASLTVSGCRGQDDQAACLARCRCFCEDEKLIDSERLIAADRPGLLRGGWRLRGDATRRAEPIANDSSLHPFRPSDLRLGSESGEATGSRRGLRREIAELGALEM